MNEHFFYILCQLIHFIVSTYSSFPFIFISKSTLCLTRSISIPVQIHTVGLRFPSTSMFIQQLLVTIIDIVYDCTLSVAQHPLL
ncbi:uncharacterized protein C8R40DRAFT_617488 [Lentinula edodes]|uniref:uncharacterized protein n=1 Tax=Lentinula edodes TaxID=5353 RepID=UPI001E8E137E|nr:uncharacterized protein C8R40DRAFT_617488 [Lentinula edodes]KAH7870945.1 hypothetical protein C8R40DRAFT_617488 [Lentinula edodes]